jgi:hypothetical protein
MMSLASAVGKCFSFIPRLVVHKAEVQRIFNPEKHPRHLRREKRQGSNSSLHGDLEVQRSSAGAIFLRGVVPNVATFTIAVRQMASDFPEHVRTVPFTIANIAADLPSTIANLVIELPSTIMMAATVLPATIVSMKEGVEETLETIVQVSSDVAREVVELPHRASFEWKQLIWVLCLLVFAPVLIFGVVFFIPLNSVNEGIQGNRRFLYGTMTFYQILTIVPWIETCNFAMPQVGIPVKARIFTLIFAIIVLKLYDAAMAEGLFHRHIFPLPFSILVSGMLAVWGVVPALYLMTPNRKNFQFRRMQNVLFAYWASLLMVIGWAVGVQRLSGSMWQSAFTFLYGPLRFVCKILIAAPITTTHNSKRWIHLNLVVDILFTRVQVATFPFIDGYITLLLLFSTELLTLFWRYYNGVDRLALWWNAIWMPAHEDGMDELTNTFGKSMTEITRGCIRASIPHIAQLSLSLREKNSKKAERISRTLTADTMPDFDEERSLPADPLERIESLNQIVPDSENDEPSMEVSVESRLDETVLTDIEAACYIADRHAGDGCESNQPLGHACGQLSDTESETFSASSVEVAAEEADLSRFVHREMSSKSVGLEEEHWEQRPLYHVVDSTGANVISIIVRVNQQLSITMVRNLPSSDHLNESFQISNERWRQAQIYGWTFVALMLLLLVVSELSFFRRLERQEGKRLTLSRVMSYLYKDHFWFFFLWLVSTGAFVCASMVNHFGADFSFRFEWVSCSDETISWPTCPVMAEG